MSVDIIILAAGKGSRMKSQKPKVLQLLAGKSLLSHVVDTATFVSEQINIVIGHGAEQVKAEFLDSSITWVKQEEQLGTAHAVSMCLTQLKGDISLVLYGDVPLIKQETLNKLIQKVSDQSMALLTVKLENPIGYGRILREKNDRVVAIVEEKDASEIQRKITEVNTGILAIKTKHLKELLPQIKANNVQKEFYLTDIVALSVANGRVIECICVENEVEVRGINDKRQLAALERAYQLLNAEKLMDQGVTIIDPNRIDIRGILKAGTDTYIDINCVFQGAVNIGNNVTIGPNCIIGEMGKLVEIGNNVEIKANSIIEEAIIEDRCSIGPFARLRPGTRLGKNSKVGNFVEIKKANIGEGSKVNHLTYIGDAIIGKDVNIGAGTITCNYDGVNKFETVIEDNVFIGSNTSIVAPITIGEGATVGAGSTINKNINKADLAVARSKQQNIQGWQRPKKK